MCMADDGDGFVVSSSATRRARRRHECGECGRLIEPTLGERYEHATGLYEGHWQTFKTCGHCVAARSWLMVTCNGFLYNGVLEDLEEHWDESWELRSHYLGRAILGMRRRWSRRDGTLMPVMRQFTRAELPELAR